MTLSLDRFIAELAAKYDGLVPTAELYEAGYCREAIARRVEVGVLSEVIRGVRRVTAVELTPVRLAMAAALVLPRSWVSHTSALALHGATLRKVDLCAEVSSPHQVRLSGVRAHRHACLDASNLGKYHSISLSRPWWAILEGASVLSERELAVAMDSLIQLKAVSVQRVGRAHDETGWYRGRAVLARLLDDRLNGLGIVRSFLEHDLFAVLKRGGLPLPIRNYVLKLPNGKERCLDFAWPEARVGVEADSWLHHSNSTDWGRTRIRDRDLAVIGWTIIPAVVADTRNPAALLAALRGLVTHVS